MRQSRNLILGLLVLLPPAAGVVPPAPGEAAGPVAPSPPVTRARYLMGTPLTVTLPGPADPGLFEAVFSEVARLEAVLSNWREDSELNRLNAGAARAPVSCSTDLFEAITRAVSWAEFTGGAFDPTVEPVVRRLGLIGDPYDARPGAGAGAGPATPVVGWRGIGFDREARSVRFAAEGIGIDMGGIGKGIALDAAGRVIRGAGRDAALLDFGGQVLAIGAPSGETAWVIGLADPDRRDRTVARLRVRDRSISTSAPRERRAPSGVGHILDPGTGAPVSFAGSVSVAAGDATAADALSTALCVMGVEAGIRWAETRDVAALFIWRDATGVLGARRTTAWDRDVLSEGPRPREAGVVETGEQ